MDRTHEQNVELMARTYPGFDRYIHELMAYVSLEGKTHEEAVELLGDLKSEIRKVIDEMNENMARRDEDGNVVLPEYVTRITEVSDEEGENPDGELEEGEIA